MGGVSILNKRASGFDVEAIIHDQQSRCDFDQRETQCRRDSDDQNANQDSAGNFTVQFASPFRAHGADQSRRGRDDQAKNRGEDVVGTWFEINMLLTVQLASLAIHALVSHFGRVKKLS